MKYLFAKLLTNDDEYSLAENFWARLFDEIAEGDRRRHGWQSPWFKPRPPCDGNQSSQPYQRSNARQFESSSISQPAMTLSLISGSTRLAARP